MSDRIGQFELREEIGRGAWARVWRAWDPLLERDVAVKVPLDAERALAGDADARFRAETAAAARLNHPGIVTVYDAGVFDGRPAVVMELLDGSPLDRMLADGPLPYRVAVLITGEVLDALQHAHGCGVIHRDIKPSNLFVTNDGRVKITDFGIAAFQGLAAADASGVVLASPGYMAPEQVEGGPVDGRADIFAAGVVLYEMLAGRNPFVGATAMATMYNNVHEPVPPLGRVDVPAGMDGVIGSATAKDPAARYATALAMKAGLSQATGIVAAGVPTGVASSKKGIPKVVLVGAGVAVAGSMLVVAGLSRPSLPVMGGGSVASSGGTVVSQVTQPMGTGAGSGSTQPSPEQLDAQAESALMRLVASALSSDGNTVDAQGVRAVPGTLKRLVSSNGAVWASATLNSGSMRIGAVVSKPAGLDWRPYFMIDLASDGYAWYFGEDFGLKQVPADVRNAVLQPGM